MKLYEVNMAIQSALDRLDFDPETGEIGENTEAVLQELDSLEMERDRILEYVAKVALNIRSDAAALKAEEDRLSKRRKALERKEEKLVSILDRECGGEKKDLGFATVSYRKSESVEVLDSAKACAWLHDNGYPNQNKIQTFMVKAVCTLFFLSIKVWILFLLLRFSKSAEFN